MTTHRIEAFVCQEDGAITVDWVVLTSAILGLTVLLLTTVGSESDALATRVSEKVDEIEVAPK